MAEPFRNRVARWHGQLRRVAEEVIAVTTSPRAGINRLRKVVYFLVLVWRGFVVNRCPVRAAALAYTTLLALVPILAVALSVSKNFLSENSAEVVPRLMDRLLAAVAPQLEVLPVEGAAAPASGQVVVSSEARQQAVAAIQGYIDNINAGALGTVGTVLLVFVGVQLMRTVEQSLNDIWGVRQGRSVWLSMVYYWTSVTLGPLLIVLAVYWTGRAEFLTVVGSLSVIPGVEQLFLRLMPFAILWVAFSLLYALLPNTRVKPSAAIVGGVLAGTLWQVNNWLSTLYVSRVVGYSKVYGALGIIPVLLIGLYLSWLIVLLGAQVAYATQHLRTYLQQRFAERIDQRGRELLACRAVFVVCEHFLRGLAPPSVEQIAGRIGAPSSWLRELADLLQVQGLVRCVSDDSGGIVPGRPPTALTLADVLQAVRTVPGAVTLTEEPTGRLAVDDLLEKLRGVERSDAANLTFSQIVAPALPDSSARPA